MPVNPRGLYMWLEMGALISRQNIGVEEVDIPSSSVYRYPPKSGKVRLTDKCFQPSMQMIYYVLLNACAK